MAEKKQIKFCFFTIKITGKEQHSTIKVKGIWYENQLDTFFCVHVFCYFIKNRGLMLENLTYAVDNIFFNWYTLANL